MPLPRLSAARFATAWAGITLLAAVGAPTAAFGAAPPRAAGEGGRTVAEVEAYWTSKRMERAKPLDVVVRSVGSGDVRARRPTATSSSQVAYSSYQLTDTTSFPNRVHGKVFFSRPGSGNFVCSGTVVDAPNRATVITAGHCVHEAGVWSTNFAFAPGYRKVAGVASAPYGVWAASAEAAPQPWVDSENLKFDVGAVVIARDGVGQAIEDAVGARAIAFDRPTSLSFRSHGYPVQPIANRPFDGTRLWACDSSPPIADMPTSATGPATMGIGCDMTGGSSGGGWVNAGYLSGVNSYRYANQPEMMYGPYFGATIKALYDFAAARPPGSPGSQGVGNAIPSAEPSPSSSPSPTSAPPPCRKARKKAKRKRVRRACKAKRARNRAAQGSATSAM